MAGAASNGPPPSAPSIYRKPICLPSCDQRGRAAYPFNCVRFRGFAPSESTVQSCAWARSPGAEKKANILESGDQAGLESERSPVVSSLISSALDPGEVEAMHAAFDELAAVVWTQATRVASGERHRSSYKTVRPNRSVSCAV